MPDFSARQRQFEATAATAQQQYNQLAVWRLGLFMAIFIAVWFVFNGGQTIWAVGVGIAGLIAFAQLMRRHRATRRTRDLNRHLAAINADEQARLGRQFTRPETGTSFAPADHAYAHDLDVFGRHSLYRLLNRTHTHDGTARLAHYLLHPATPDATRLRQQAAEALKPHIDWRQELEATAMLNEQMGQPTAGLRSWAAGNTHIPGWLGATRYVLPVVTVGLFVAWVLGYVSGWSVLVMLAVHGAVLGTLRETTQQVGEQTHEIAQALTAFADLFRLAERLPGEAALLTDLRGQVSGSVAASVAVGQLARLVENFNFRRNPYFYLFVGLPSLWDAHYLVALNRWRAQHGPALTHWFAVLAELEALNSLAGFAHAHPDYARPDLLENEPLTLDMHDLAHPLIPPQRAVSNSLTVSGIGQTTLITGSNMSGKSTFLRTVGLNLVLAQAGAVVAARRFAWSPVQLYTSMRTQDSLEENTSSFYAELKRLRTLIEMTQPDAAGTLPADDGVPVLYFLDEILKGTNSADRHKGAEALIRQLHRANASGFVSTHDLELGQLGDAVDFVQNYHFRSDIRDGQVTFDYQLRPGICPSFNASQLMAAIGINV